MKTMLRWLWLQLLCYDALASAASLEEWKGRSIYQVLTDRFAIAGSTTSNNVRCAVTDGLYCGGSWQGIKENLDYIQGMNFDAIWISPVVAQLPQRTGDGEAYSAYWQQDLYSLNPSFGTKDDLNDLIREVHDRDMFLMLDVVVNHMAYAGLPRLIDYSVLNPFDDPIYYHDYCQVDDSSITNIEQCWLGDTLVPLADLRTEDADVRQMYGQWISQMVFNYSIDGLRIDTAINVEPGFFPGFVDSSGVFATGETMSGSDSLVCQWAETIGSILNYPIYYPLTAAFENTTGSIGDLAASIESVKENCKDPNALGSFSENHDVPRFAEYTDDMSLAKNIITYTIMADGIPIIYQGQEQHMTGSTAPYTNRAPLWDAGYNTTAPLYRHIATLNRFRQHVLWASTNYTDYLTEVIYQDYHSLGLRKGFDGGQVITVLNNNGEDQPSFTLNVTDHGYASGVVLTEILACTNVTVNKHGDIILPMDDGQPRILYPASLMYNSSLCDAPALSPISTTSISRAISTTISGYSTILETHSVETLYATLTDASATTVQTSATPTPSSSGSLGSAHHHHTHARTSLLVSVVLVATIAGGI